MDVESVATVIGESAIALSFLAAVVFGISQVRTSAEDRRERLTVEVVRGMQTREMAEHFHRISAHDIPSTWAQMRTLPEDELVSLIHYAQQMEMLGLMVYDGMIELSLVERTLGDYVGFSWEKYKSFTYDRRKDDPYLNEYFEWLANRLDEYMRSNPRPPAYAEISAQSQPR
jgi:hypothetical protein